MRPITRIAVLAVLSLTGAFIVLWSTTGKDQSARAVTISPAETRVYYIAADEVDWNYAPTGRNVIAGRPFDDDEDVFTAQGPDRIGSTYKKALYRQYTDATFSRLQPKDPRWEHTGFLGPTIRAEVGDTIRVVFRNNATVPYSIHPHGVRYAKSSEGAPYNDGTSGADKADDAVPPGGTVTYTWQVPARSGPAAHDGQSVMWMYHSHTNEVEDTNTGLMGPMIIYPNGALRDDGSVVGIDREFVAVFSVMNENESHYLQRKSASSPAIRHPSIPTTRTSRRATSCTPSTVTCTATAPS